MPDPADVVFEDESFIAFNKPSGLLVSPDRWKPDRPSLHAWVHERFSPEWNEVYRIDADTSGLVLFAKNKAALGALAGQIEKGRAHKYFVALIRRHIEPPAGEMRHQLAQDHTRPGRMRVVKRGREAVTKYETLESWRNFSWLKLEPLTGRTHQIRVQLAHQRCPILCDAFYGTTAPLLLSTFKRRYKESAGEERPLLARLALHAERLAFTHPVSGAETEITAPLFKDMRVALLQLQKYSK